MTSAEIRNSFLDFFKEKQHTTVPSASILPQSPGLLFTNAGMNQFVPYFLGTEKAPYDPPRAADTQKCIRAGGKHNDLEDVGYDTYHHTFFEMLGNWSFGNYFKEEAIAWAWELVVERWGLPANRLYATVYAPSEGDPSEFDHEAYQLWKGFFEKAGLDPKIHIVNGNVEDNFWKMGDTGPCGPCSELHVDMTPNGDTGGKLVNMDSDLCIEIWNLVFIQYNAEEDGTYRDLPSKHVDTGMGFERVCSLIQNTKNFTDFSKKPTNYATDVFQPIFRMLEKLSGKKYVDVYPGEESDALEQAIAFRVIADHIRTLSFSIADSIIPGNTGRNYVLRRILRRAVKYGRTLGFNGNEPFLPRLVDTLVEEFSHVFPEIKTRAAVIKETLTLEEESFNKTLDRGMEKFEKAAGENVFPPEDAFQLYDTFGFPLDLTALLCRERGITLDEKAVEARMEEARKLSRASQKKMVVRATEISTDVITEFLGFEKNSCEAIVLEIHGNLVITDKTVFFTEMGGQEGDTGTLNDSTITSTQQIGSAIAHQIEGNIPAVGDTVDLTINRERRSHIEAHHTATHLLHWAIHKVISPDASQQGSSVSPDRLTFDFNSKAVTPEQIEAIEERVNSAIKADDTVSWVEVPHSKVKDREDIMQFFGDKYGDLVRVVQIGGGGGVVSFDMGTALTIDCQIYGVANCRNITFDLVSDRGAGIRRIEAVCGPAAEAFLGEQQEKESAEKSEALAKLAKANEALAKLDAPTLLVPDNARAFEVKNQAIEAEKALKKAQATGAARMADSLIAEKNITENIVISTAGSPALLQELLNGLRKTHFTQAAFIVIDDGNKLHLGAFCGEEGKRNGHGAGTLIQKLGPIAGGKGGGKPDMARGAASDRDKISELATAANTELGL
ncbi:alanine--tRNA ligase [Akkermansiaceae bacterium]|nr:alanine--tRNA ligase [Akkermansiaceae bacterium]